MAFKLLIWQHRDTLNINDIVKDCIVLHYKFQVLAHDLDSDVNGKVSYSIARGDRHKQFSVDEKTGYIAVAGNLDREMVCYISYFPKI